MDNKTHQTIILSVLVTVGIFVLDWLTPMGFALWFLYAIPLLMAARLGVKYLLPSAICFIILLLVGFLIEIPGEGPRIIEIDLLNRSVGAATLIGLAVGLIEMNESRDALRRSKSELEETVKALIDSRKRLQFVASQVLNAQENERRRIGAELHDSVGGALTGLKLQIERLYTEAETTPAASEKSLGHLIKIIQDIMQEIRRIQLDLRPPILDSFGLVAALVWLCRELEKQGQRMIVAREIEVEETRVPDSLRIVIFRVAQEALHNIAKHSKADHVTVSFRENDGKIELRIQDNGQGFDLIKAASPKSSNVGLGLGTMRERTELSGGSFEINSAPGKGTTLLASWPAKMTED